MAKVKQQEQHTQTHVELRHIKEEPEWSVKQEAQEFHLHFITVKTEKDEDEWSVLHHREEPDGEECGAGCSSHLLTQLHPDPELSDTDDSEDYCQTETVVKRSSVFLPPDVSVREHIPFSCLECGEMIQREEDVTEHMSIHSVEKSFLCSECGHCFESKSALLRHKEEIHFICPLCSRQFIKSLHLGNHLRAHKRKRAAESGLVKQFSCLECGKSFWSENVLHKHLKYHREPMPFRCSQCEDSFMTRKKLRYHLKSHSLHKPFKCSVCNKRFAVKAALGTHMRLHGEKSFPCPACAKRFVVQLDLTKHLKTHHHICPVCSKGFRDKLELKAHLSSHSEAALQEATKPFGCADCGRRFSSEAVLQKHHRENHSEKRPFQCSVCERRFKVESLLQSHMKSHTYACPECGINCGNKHPLVLHLTHEHLICSVCRERFSDRESLKDHLQTHSGVCPECGLQPEMTSLSLHLSRAHLICWICKERLSDKVALKQHLQTHIEDGTLDLSSDLIFSCSDCGELFFYESLLLRHESENKCYQVKMGLL